MHNWPLGATGSVIMLSFALIIAGSEVGRRREPSASLANPRLSCAEWPMFRCPAALHASTIKALTTQAGGSTWRTWALGRPLYSTRGQVRC